MAKKKDLGISVEMLQGMSYQAEEETKKVREARLQREMEEQKQREENLEYEEESRVVVKKPAVKKFDRKRERPIQKTVHLSIEADNKVNMVKSVLKTLGKKTTFEDLLFDLLNEWLKENYDDILAGKMVYPGE